MNPERWRQIDRLFLAALEREDEERVAFLDEGCAGDKGLRREVESLIASNEQAYTFIERPAFEAAAEMLAEDQARLARGQRLDHYEIIRLLGEGGMGEVYLAQDRRLDRTIALKLLPACFTTDAERLRRFEQEAHAASALNHPNILTIHEIEQVDEVHFIAMEYIDGVTLRQRMSLSRLALGESLDIAIQVASALVAAHRAGVVHRDIKPENLMLREDGIVKVLDFGIAKLLEQPVAEPATGAIAQVKTDTGVVMGTSSYMSPEQARGLAVDARTDIWSLGVVLYEMAAGRVPFEGATTSDVVVSILEHAPLPLAQYCPEPPAELQRIISKTLHKEREKRYQTAKDLVIELKSLKQDLEFEAKLEHSSQPGLSGKGRFRTSETVPAARSQPTWWGNRLFWLSIAVILVVGVAVKFYSSRLSSESLTRTRSESSLPPMKVMPFTNFAGHEGTPAFSPDGNQIAFAWDGGTSDNIDIYVKLIGAGAPLRLTTHPGIDRSPTWSPDGRYIAFSRFSESEKGIFIVPALGGTERKLYSPDWGFHGFGGVVWSPDGKLLAYLDRSSPQSNYGIWLLSVENLERRQLTWPPAQNLFDMVPAFSPDGQTLAFARLSSGRVSDIYLVPIGGGEPRRLTFDNREIDGLAWTPDGREIVFPSDRGGGYGLWRISVTGDTPERLAVGGDNDFSPPLSPQGNRLAMSRQGNRLAYVQSAFDTNIWRIEIPESKGRSNPPTRLIASTNLDQGPQYSPDGKRIAFESTRSGSYEIWVCDSDGANLVQLTSFDRTTGTPRWSPDGRHIAFDSRKETHSDIYVISAEGGSPRRLTTENSDDVVPSWSRNGRWIYFASNRTGVQQVWKVPAEGGEAVQVTKRGGFAAFESPDGKFVYYTARDPGIWRVAVEGGEEAQVLDQPKLGYWGNWAVVDGGIYFVNVELKLHPTIEFFNFATGRVRQIAAMEKEAVLGGPGFAISPDGRWILYAQVDQSGSDIVLVENFQ
jgi:Tol biopolymer transport system component/predicted Ser/Thr protein kinase